MTKFNIPKTKTCTNESCLLQTLNRAYLKKTSLLEVNNTMTTMINITHRKMLPSSHYFNYQ